MVNKRGGRSNGGVDGLKGDCEREVGEDAHTCWSADSSMQALKVKFFDVAFTEPRPKSSIVWLASVTDRLPTDARSHHQRQRGTTTQPPV